MAATGLAAHLDDVHSSHDYGAAKEQEVFWQRFQDAVGFDPAQTLFVDDNPRVLQAARDFGIAQTVAIAQPDSSRPPSEGPVAGATSVVRGVADLVSGVSSAEVAPRG